MGNYIGVIFDFNGTMLFDGKYHDRAWRSYIEELTMQEVSALEEKNHIKGRTPKEILEHFIGYELSDNMVNQFSEEKERLYRSYVSDDEVELAPGLIKFLNYLTIAGVPKAIATTANLSNMNLYFEKYNLDMWFPWENVIIGTGNIPLKPHPDIYLAAISKIGVDASKCIAFEDSEAGVKAAFAAGIRHIILVTGDRCDDSLKDMPGVYSVINDFTELSPEKFK